MFYDILMQKLRYVYRKIYKSMEALWKETGNSHGNQGSSIKIIKNFNKPKI